MNFYFFFKENNFQYIYDGINIKLGENNKIINFKLLIFVDSKSFFKDVFSIYSVLI